MDWLAWLTALAAVAAAGFAGWLVFVGQRQVAIGQQQVAVSQEQAKQSLELLYDSRRPILMPVSALPLSEQSNQRHFDFRQAECPIALRNIGSGVAVNIRAVLFPPDPGDSPIHVDRQTLWYGEPLEAQQSIETKTNTGMTSINGNAVIGAEPNTFTLFAPPVPTGGDRMMLDIPGMAARLTITYHDVYGRKHASVFDFTDLGRWHGVRFLIDVPKDIEDLDREERQRRADAQKHNSIDFSLVPPGVRRVLPPGL